MNKLILCEGKTDAILLSYYLGKTAGWKFDRKGPKGLNFQRSNSNESLSWYKKGDDYLLICGVGGKDNFGRFFHARIRNGDTERTYGSIRNRNAGCNIRKCI